MILPDDLIWSETPTIGDMIDIFSRRGGKVIAVKQVPDEAVPSLGIVDHRATDDTVSRILGVVENESYFVCDGCDKRHELFGAGGGAKVAEFAEAPLLGQIPIEPDVAKWGDAGVPVVQAAPDSGVAKEFNVIAEKLVEAVERRSDLAQGPLTIDRSGGVNRHLPITR